MKQKTSGIVWVVVAALVCFCATMADDGSCDSSEDGDRDGA